MLQKNCSLFFDSSAFAEIILKSIYPCVFIEFQDFVYQHQAFAGCKNFWNLLTYTIYKICYIICLENFLWLKTLLPMNLTFLRLTLLPSLK